MTGDRWTLLLLRDEQSHIRQISVSKRAVRLFVGGSTALVVGLAAIAATIGIDGAAHLRASRLALENETLSQELSSIQTRVNGMEGRLGSLSTMDSRLRLLAGLNSIDPEVLQVGIGGPSTSSPQLNSLWPVDSTLSKAAFAIRYDLNVLERKAGLLRESMDEATDSLMAHTDLLESTPSILPAAGIISSPFSKSRYHPIHQSPLPHEGVDIAAVMGTPIFAAAKGVVTKSEWAVGYGQMVELDHGFGYTTRYGHASRQLVRVGQRVTRGDVIALVGNTGIATSPHLHYEVRVQTKPVNPLNYVISGAIP
jgi:murein DD-endopeptidase MepM/ murein hydrolase activator NlpD